MDSKMQSLSQLPPDPEARAEYLRTLLTAAVRRSCPGWLESQIEDLVHGCVIKVMAILEKNEGKGDLSPSYMWRVAYSAVIDEIRRRRRLREVPIETQEGVLDLRSSFPGPERQTISSGVAKGIRSCLAALPQARRTAVTLHLLGHSVPEIARLLEWKSKRADNLVYRGIDDLRQCLRAKGVTP
jgi:RNA polymerase sigma-70 factor (ECF subfamily)